MADNIIVNCVIVLTEAPLHEVALIAVRVDTRIHVSAATCSKRAKH